MMKGKTDNHTLHTTTITTFCHQPYTPQAMHMLKKNYPKANNHVILVLPQVHPRSLVGS